MTPDERKAARKRCEQVPPAPWTWEPTASECGTPYQHIRCGPKALLDTWHWDAICAGVETVPPSHGNAALADFVVGARTDLPAALDQIDADEALMREMLDYLVGYTAACFSLTCQEPECLRARKLRARLGEAPETEDKP